VGNGQQQLKQNQRDQHLNGSPNQQMNDSADLSKRVKDLEKELYVNQDAFNRTLHQEVEKINEDDRRRSPSTTTTDHHGVQKTNANAAQCCTLS